ncbi:hypothetical protein Hanom_Chr16g01471341 [Helianthus anomalus]
MPSTDLLTFLSHPSQSIFTLISTVYQQTIWKKKSKVSSCKSNYNYLFKIFCFTLNRYISQVNILAPFMYTWKRGNNLLVDGIVDGR